MRTPLTMRTDLNTFRPIQGPIKCGPIVVMVCLIAATGCSRLGSNGALSQRRIPYPPQPLRQSASKTASETTPQTAASQPTATQNRDLETVLNSDRERPVRPDFDALRNGVRDFKPRPPKLAEFPKTTLVAEPVIDQSAQVSFQQNDSDFNPAAEPPAQIFSQPLIEPRKPVANTEQLREAQLSVATINPVVRPENFAANGHQADGPVPSRGQVSTFGEALARFSTDAPTADQLNPLSEKADSEFERSRQILLVTDPAEVNQKQPAAADEKVQQVNAVEPSAIKFVEVDPNSTRNSLPTSAPLRPAATAISPSVDGLQLPIVKEYAAVANQGAPIVDASLQGEIYLKSPAQRRDSTNSAKETTRTPMIAKSEFEAENLTAKLNSSVSSVTDSIRLTDQHREGRLNGDDSKPSEIEFKPSSELELADDSALGQNESGITIDPNLGQQRERQLNFAPRPIVAAKPTPAPVVYQRRKAPFLMLPRISKPISGALETKIASVAKNDFVVPPKKCVTCTNPACQGCNIPQKDHFAQTSPMIDGGRSLAPMAVESAAGFEDATEITRKNYGQVSFSSKPLPLPETIVSDPENIANSFEAQFAVESEFEKTQTQSDVPPVGVDAVMKLNAVTWRSRLQQTIELVQEQLEGNIDSETRTSMEINLRLLDVLSRQMEEVAQEQRRFTDSENQFWQHQLEAITSMLKTEPLVDVRDNDLLQHQTAHQTLTHLRQAIAELESLANLKITSGAFCTEVSGYGQFEVFPRGALAPGQKVLVYCEVENYNTIERPSDSGATFHTQLRGSYAIYDASGHAVQQAEFPVVEDVARKRRRDFYMHLPITIGDLSAGNYELHLLVEDLGGNKTASLTPPLTFAVSATGQSDLQARSKSDSTWVR